MVKEFTYCDLCGADITKNKKGKGYLKMQGMTNSSDKNLSVHLDDICKDCMSKIVASIIKIAKIPLKVE